jgi:Lanthionine synthetase C-like protein
VTGLTEGPQGRPRDARDERAERGGPDPLAARAEELGLLATEWLVAQGRPTGAGLAWSTRPGDEETNPSLHQGTGGAVLALLESRAHFGEDRFGEAALLGARSIAEDVATADHDSLYFGLAGHAFVLRAVQRELGDEESGAAADRALARIRARFDGERWNPMFELFAGNAGIGLAALAVADLELAVTAVAPYLKLADETAGGVNWPVRPSPPRSHHIAHGTLGIALALAEVGRAAGRRDLIELALRGAADAVARNEAGPEGFVVPHSDPPHRPDIIERYSYGWCNGPAGDAIVFRLLGDVTGDPAWAGHGDRCWHTLTTCGLPQRLRPGFWDNSARCCGTASVLAAASDRLAVRAAAPAPAPATATVAAAATAADGAAQGGIGAFAEVLFADIDARATVDAAGARWSNYEHKATPPELEPQTGWAHGNAGIIRELLRYARLRTGRDPAYAVAMPDHPQVAAESGAGDRCR